MLAEGAVEAREPRVYGARGRGRPAKVFALTEAGRDRFDQQYDDLAVQALRFLAETGGDAAVAGVRPPPGRRHRGRATTRSSPREPGARRRPRRWPRRSPRAATLPRSARARSASSSASTTARSRTSPHEFPQLCEAETEVISRVLGRHVQRLATIAHGDGVCTTCIPARPQHHRRTSHRHRHTRG